MFMLTIFESVSRILKDAFLPDFEISNPRNLDSMKFILNI